MNNKEFKCNYCEAVFKHRQSRHKHSISCKENGKVKNFVCTVCSQEFTRKDVLIKHQRGRCKRKEDRKKENKCETCGKVFAKKANLTRHFTIHNKTNHECIHCNKTFKRQDHFHQHVCQPNAPKRTTRNKQPRQPRSLDFTEEESFDIEKAYDACFFNLKETSISLSDLSMAFSEKVRTSSSSLFVSLIALF